MKQEPLSRSHGTWRGYRTFKCRCPKCRAFRSEQNRIERERRLARPIPLLVHGTYNGYTNYGCLCMPCDIAAREYTKIQNARYYQEVRKPRERKS